ncbi:MAG: preprotein translocase subunit YajC [Verrucomicrobiota bacterium]|nr:preprotein translocase subunit YajC [Verrucomicrobiota bacterium]
MISHAFLVLAQAPAPPDPGLNIMVMMGFAFALIYFISIRPQQRRAKQLAAQIASLKTGDKVITSSGIHGVVANVKEGSTLSLKVADNVRIEIDKSAITTIVKPNVDAKSDARPAELKS